MIKRVFGKILNIMRPLLYKKGVVVCREMASLGRPRKFDVLNKYPDMDYIRLSQLELVADEIYSNNVSGAVAELGVYTGNFAHFISQAFPRRKFYLFDTFEGFSKKDWEIEKGMNLDSVYQDFSSTSMEIVLNRIIDKERCIVKKGYFPDTAKNVDEEFCFVSIDADLYEPIIEGLKFFYSHLVNGGYIFIHDYNQSWYKGSKKAVQEFCNKNKISYIPISDYGGTCIISKPK